MPSPDTRRGLYPAIEPYRQGHLAVSGDHELYYEECGNPAGKPVVFLHGGPGGGAGPRARRFFDPARYRIVVFDQRGCGRSRPHASLEANTTWDLLADIERLRESLAIEAWQVFGGSWGSTLALLYAEANPTRVTELVLRGIFLLRRWELEWFYQAGAPALYPDAHAEFAALIPEAERGDLLRAYHRRLTGPDEAAALAAAQAWTRWEAATSYLLPSTEFVAQLTEARTALAMARIETHYFVNGGFMAADNQILQDSRRLAGIPGVIVQGRYDVVCPPCNAWALHRAWPASDLRLVADAGHAAYEPGTVDELVRATDRFAAGL